MEGDRYRDGNKTVEIFGTLLKETKKAYLFAPEDEGEFWFAKSICEWDGLAMSMPMWLARKNKLVSYLPADEDPCWEIILKPPTKRIFIATKIEKIDAHC